MGEFPSCALGVEISGDRLSCAVAKAWRQPDDRVAVKVVWRGAPGFAADVVDALYVADELVEVALDPRSPSVTLVAPLAERGIVVRRLGAEDVAVAHGELLDLVASGGLRHFGQAELTAAVRGAGQRPVAGAAGWDRRVVPDQSPLLAANGAVWALRRWEEVSSPGVYVM